MKKSLFPKLLALMACIMFSMNAMAAEAYVEYTPDNETLTFHYDNLRSTRPGTTYDMVKGDSIPGWSGLYLTQTIKHVVFDPEFAGARPTTTAFWFDNFWDVEYITGLNYLNTEEVTNMRCMFCECYSLKSVDLSNFNTAKVTDMTAMFNYCLSLTSLDVSSFNTANVKLMAGMFRDCRLLTSLDLSNFNTANVTTMEYLFRNCYALESLDVSSFNTSKVTNMFCMFEHCRELTTLDLSSFDTRSVTTMRDMFYACMNVLKLDLSHFNTANVTDMAYMFEGCHNVQVIDMSGFNTAKVTNMTRMFHHCYYLTTIFVGNGWTTDAVTSSDNMFFESERIVGGQGTVYDPDHVDAEYAHIDGGPANPGYFDRWYTFLRGDVNGDGYVNMADVSALAGYLLTGDPTGIVILATDVDENAKTNVADISALINYLLTGYW